MDAINRVVWSYKENDEQLSDPILQETVLRVQKDDPNGEAAPDAAFIARLIVQIPRAASLVEPHQCETALTFLGCLGYKMRALVGTELTKEIQGIQRKQISTEIDNPEAIANVFLMCLARLFGLLADVDVPENFEELIDSFSDSDILRDHILASYTARLCVTRWVRMRCRSYKEEKARAIEESQANMAVLNDRKALGDDALELDESATLQDGDDQSEGSDSEVGIVPRLSTTRGNGKKRGRPSKADIERQSREDGAASKAKGIKPLRPVADGESPGDRRTMSGTKRGELRKAGGESRSNGHQDGDEHTTASKIPAKKRRRSVQDRVEHKGGQSTKDEDVEPSDITATSSDRNTLSMEMSEPKGRDKPVSAATKISRSSVSDQGSIDQPEELDGGETIERDAKPPRQRPLGDLPPATDNAGAMDRWGNNVISPGNHPDELKYLGESGGPDEQTLEFLRRILHDENGERIRIAAPSRPVGHFDRHLRSTKPVVLAENASRRRTNRTPQSRPTSRTSIEISDEEEMSKTSCRTRNRMLYVLPDDADDDDEEEVPAQMVSTSTPVEDVEDSDVPKATGRSRNRLRYVLSDADD